MCGFSGVVGGICDYRKFEQLSQKYLSTRGPDAFSRNHFPSIGAFITHARLSLIDLEERSNQPFLSACGRFSLVYNGELYNYKSLRRVLSEHGYKFRTLSDTEVFMNGLLHYGVVEFLSQHVEGMFAFALLDLKTGTTFLGRDLAGQKPLNYHIRSKQLMFASDSRIIEYFNDTTSLNAKAIASFLAFGFIQGDKTLCNEVQSVCPGTVVKISDKFDIEYLNIEIKKSEVLTDLNLSYEKFKRSLIESVELSLQADVPVGIFLSSGLDSSVIALITKKVFKENLMCFSIGAGLKQSEEQAISQFCDINKLNSTIFGVSEKSLTESFMNYPKLYDRPMADTSCALISFLSQNCKSRTRCVLTGDGADELFWSYPRYRKMRTIKRVNQLIPAKRIFNTMMRGRKLRKFCAEDEMASYYQSIDITNKLELLRLKDFAWAGEIFDGDWHEYLPNNCLVKTDRATMGFGIEARAPFLNKTVIGTARGMDSQLRIQVGLEKLFHRRLFAELAGYPYPDLKKKGFSANPRVIKAAAGTKFDEFLTIGFDVSAAAGLAPSITEFRKSEIYEWRLFSLGVFLNERA